MSDPKKTAKKATSKLPEGTESAPLENANVNVTDDSFNFEAPDAGELFGGSYPRLELLPNQVTVPLVYRKDTEIPLDGDPDENGNPTTKMQTVYVAETPNGVHVSCPISAIFMKHFKEAKIEKGDEFRIKRFPNATKKRGKGAGREMQVYAVMVTARAKAES